MVNHALVFQPLKLKEALAGETLKAGLDSEQTGGRGLKEVGAGWTGQERWEDGKP